MWLCLEDVSFLPDWRQGQSYRSLPLWLRNQAESMPIKTHSLMSGRKCCCTCSEVSQFVPPGIKRTPQKKKYPGFFLQLPILTSQEGLLTMMPEILFLGNFCALGTMLNSSPVSTPLNLWQCFKAGSSPWWHMILGGGQIFFLELWAVEFVRWTDKKIWPSFQCLLKILASRNLGGHNLARK